MKPSETSNDSETDPLDEPSGSSIYVRGEKGERVEKELTFRELHDYCARNLTPLDDLTPKVRMIIEREMDPSYRPLAPYEGMTRFRRRHR